ncbi:TPA: helix-turn-helix domain-containing protein, partial [Streptococcus suis]
MINQENHIATNLRFLRNKYSMSQEAVAEKINVSRQAVAKWESGETLPDIMNCDALAVLFDVSLNDLVRFNPEKEGMPIGPKDKYIFGTVTIGERGQIVLPKKARDIMNLIPGDTLIVLGDTSKGNEGIALISDRVFFRESGRSF